MTNQPLLYYFLHNFVRCVLKKFGTVTKRISAALPEITLAWACYIGAGDALSGELPGLYLVGLVAIEIVSLSWLRLVMAPALIGRSTSVLRTLMGIGGTGAAMLMLLINGMTVFFLFLFVMLFDPRSFVLLLLALTRRSLWLWSWGLRSVENAELVIEHSRRVTRAHFLAIATAVITALLFDRFFQVDAKNHMAFTNALWLAGMSGYFIALAIYIITGKTPIPEEEKKAAWDVPPLPPMNLTGLLKKGMANWMNFLPGIMVTWFVMEVLWAFIPDRVVYIASPLGIAFSGWALVGGACVTLGISDKSAWEYGLSKAAGFGYPLVLLWLLTLFLFFISLPLIYGVLGLKIEAPPEITIALGIGFVVALMIIFYILVRLWPVCIIYFVDKGRGPSSPFKAVWRLTSGIRTFFYGALPPVLVLAVILFVLAVSTNFSVLGKLLVYPILAPAAALIATERVQAMLNARQKAALRIRIPHSHGTSSPAMANVHSQKTPPNAVPDVGPPPTKDREQRPAETEYTYSDAWTPEDVFLSAVYNQDISTMQKQLDAGVSVDSKADGDVALLWAARLNKPVSFRFLLDHDGDVYGRSITGGTALHYAAMHPEMAGFLPLLKEWWETVDVTDNYGKTPLMSAVIRGCAEGARKLLELGADPLATDQKNSNVIYHFVDGIYGFKKDAIDPDNLALLRELLLLGVDPLQLGAYGWHPVSIAGRKGLSAVLAVFRDFGVGIEQPDQHGLTAISAAAVSGEFETVRALQSGGTRMDFAGAVCTGMADFVKAYISDHPAALDEGIGDHRAPPISLAIFHGQRDMVRLLLETGASVQRYDPYGGSVLHNAVRHLPDESLIQQMIDAGADVNAMDGDANTPLNFAARQDDLALARLLLKNGADPNAETERGYAVIRFARSDSMQRLLVKYGATTKGLDV